MSRTVTRIAIAVSTAVSLLTLTACGDREERVIDHANLIADRGFENVQLADRSNNVILYYTADVPCDAFGALPVEIRVNTDFDEPIKRIEIFDFEYRELPNGTRAEYLTVDELRDPVNVKEIGISNCLSEPPA